MNISVYVKFRLQDEENVSFLAWTTTPWTLPGNMALAVGADVDYVKVKIKDEKDNGKEEFLILAKTRAEHVLKAYTYEVIEEMKGSALAGKSYEPVFDTYKTAELKNKENAWKVWVAEFVSDTDGTGIVHIAPGFGDDDMKLSQANNIPFDAFEQLEGLPNPRMSRKTAISLLTSRSLNISPRTALFLRKKKLCTHIRIAGDAILRFLTLRPLPGS